MKKFGLLFFMVFFTISYAMAQRTVVGMVSDSDGEALIGATVLVKGTSKGTVTDIDGKYSVEVPADATTLIFSYTGYETQEIQLGASNVVNVSLLEGVTLTEAVVTALGIEREKKSLGYATQEVEGEELTRVKDVNFINSLSGKVAGVDIKRSTTLGGSSNVIIRGYKSITGNNQALFVVNGVPINNDISNSTDQRTGRGGYDYGNAAMDINPEDVENVSVLRGAAATALYGSRAANGVILITTKKGAKKKALGVTFNSGLIAGTIDKTTMPRYQKEYGHGYSTLRGWYASDANPDDPNGFDYFDFGLGAGPQLTGAVYEDASYGPAFDPNLQVYNWKSYYPELSTYGQLQPHIAGENDALSFYQTSLTYNNSVSIDGGTDKSTYRLSYTNFDQKGVLPNSRIKRNTIAFAGSYDITDRLTASSSVNFINTQGQGRYGTGYDSRNVNQSFRQWYAVSTDILEQKEAYEATGKNISWNPYGSLNPDIATQPHYFDNYYWTVYENFQTDERNRIIGNINLTYKLTDWLDVLGRVAMDRYSEIQEERIAIGSVDVPKYERYNKDFSEMNYDFILNFNKYLGSDNMVNLNGNLGLNIRRTQFEDLRNQTNGGLVIPGLYSLTNSVGPIGAPKDGSGNELDWERQWEIGVNGYFGRASIGYGNFLYLDLAGRYDISSTLPEDNNAYFYPSASLSFVFSEFIQSDVFSFGKLRLNYAEVGNDAPALSITNTYDLITPFSGVALASAPNTLNNANLLPESTKSFEAGLEMNFLRNRIGLDFSVYKSNTYDQIIPVSVTGATGSLFKFVNAGNIENRGAELSLNVMPVKTNDFSWNIGINWSANRNEVKELFGDQTNLQLATAQGGISVNATIGESYGAIWGTDYVYHTNGEPIVYPMPASLGTGMRFRKTSRPGVIGDINPDWRGGVMNTLNYKGLALSFLIDIQKGGDFFSLDTWYGTATGIYDFTAGVNDLGNPVRSLPTLDSNGNPNGGGLPIGGVVQTGTDENGNPISDGTVNKMYGYAADVYSAFGYVYAPNAHHIIDASYVKLRELALTYSLPRSMFANTLLAGVDISLIGRNLWIISKNSEYSDPEAGLSAGNVQGNQSGAYPAVKEYGVNLRVKF